MIKETIICIVIIVAIFALDYTTQSYTAKSIDTLKEKISKLELDIENNRTEEIKANIENINDTWKNSEEKLAYFLEHDELEKINSELKELTSYIKTDEKHLAISKTEKAKFILEHIKDKNSFKLENIF